MGPYGASIFLSAFLLFAVQPMLGKALLPWFGGSPAVWTTCVLFFQVALLGGYGWAHRLARLEPARQALLHLGLVAFSLAWIGAGASVWATPLLPDSSWRPTDSLDPGWRVLRVLLAGPGLPYVALSATSPLLQSWFARVRPGQSPWRLYALSNAASLAALLAYPFLVEPLLPLRVQAWAWTGLFLALAGFLAWSARPLFTLGLAAAPVAGAAAAAAATEPQPPGLPRRIAWLLLAALPSTMLLAVTNHVCQEVAVVPFLWVLPLSLYLLSFILCFDSDRWYSRGRFAPALAALLVAAAALLVFKAPVVAQIAVFNLLLFATGMVCHGELAALRPDPAHLTGFYLRVAAGGALGSSLVGLVAPLLFDTFFELDLALLAAAVVTAVLVRDRRWLPGRGMLARRLAVNALGFLLGGLVVMHGVSQQVGRLAAARGFYGTLRVRADTRGPGGARRVGLLHGATTHGFQIDRDAERRLPTAYFGPGSGIGQAIERHPRRIRGEPMRLGVVGLGIGTLAAYARPGDTVRFYEISPEVVAVARDPKLFTFVSGAQGSVEVVLGDGRLELEAELARSGPQRFDVLAMDAFGSDSVPVHLLTREAFAVWAAHLRGPESVLAVNVLNRTLDLAPLVARTGAGLGFTARHVTRTPPGGDDDPVELRSDWVLLARDAGALPPGDAVTMTGTERPVRPWTDDYSNPAAILRPWGR